MKAFFYARLAVRILLGTSLKQVNIRGKLSFGHENLSNELMSL